MPLFGKDRQAGQRAVFRPPPDFTPLTSLWVNVAVGAETTVTLQHDYPPADFAPEAGWRADVAGKTYAVTAVHGRVLTCVAEGGGP